MGRDTARTRPHRCETAPRTSLIAIEDPLDEPDYLPIGQKIKIKLADGKRTGRLEHTQEKTSFWNADGKPIWARICPEAFGDIESFQDEAELRLLWSRPTPQIAAN
ncbi:MAG UNVERIFIED_CONTAM: hypothetical protein LVR29_24780 [Microcystis novacekii LVE1205-3]|jgi:type I restriction enzyme R subunit